MFVSLDPPHTTPSVDPVPSYFNPVNTFHFIARSSILISLSSLFLGLPVGLFSSIFSKYSFVCGPGSSVGIATGYGLDRPGIESQWGARYSAPVQTGPGAHPASCTMGTGSFPGVKSGRGVLLTTYPF